jgi:hypothetical protein
LNILIIYKEPYHKGKDVHVLFFNWASNH